MIALASFSCGEGGGTGSQTNALSVDLAASYADVERCTGLAAASPSLQWENVRPCPTSGKRCCLAEAETFPCGEGTCGLEGAYVEASSTVLLPEGCADAFRHEAIHHLMFVNGRPDWRDHGALEFLCQ